MVRDGLARLVWVVDDNVIDWQVAARILADLDCSAEHFPDARALYAALDTGARPSLLLLDLVLPEISGFSVLRRLVQEPEYADMPVIVVSGCCDPGPAAKLAGAMGYLSKPLTLAKLQRLLVPAAGPEPVNSRPEGPTSAAPPG